MNSIVIYLRNENNVLIGKEFGGQMYHTNKFCYDCLGIEEPILDLIYKKYKISTILFVVSNWNGNVNGYDSELVGICDNGKEYHLICKGHKYYTEYLREGLIIEISK